MFRFAQHDSSKQTVDKDNSPADRDHLAIWLVIISKVMFSRFSFDHAEKELLELVITRAGTQWPHDIELQIAAKTRSQFPIARKSQFIAGLAEMQICHRTDETDTLRTARNLIVRGRTICSKFRLRNQTAVR
jgi:hypothetical protein